MHHFFGKRLGRFQFRGLVGWSKHRETGGLEGIHASGQQSLGPYDHQVWLEFLAEFYDKLRRGHVNGIDGNFFGDTGIAGSTAHLGYHWIGAEGLAQLRVHGHLGPRLMFHAS